LAVALVLAGLLVVSCSKPEAESKKQVHDEGVPVTVAKAETVTADRAIPIVGTLYPKDEATVGAEVEGRVEKTTVDFGDRVTEGQELAQIDTAAYEALANQAAANADRARATAANAEQNLKRTEELRKNSIASLSDMDKAVADAEQARADVKAFEAALAVARLNMTRSRVKAPFDGAIAERTVGAGDFVKVGSPLFHMVNDRLIKYIVSIPERYASDVRKEQLVQFTVDAYPGEVFEGSVLLISPSINTKSRALTFGALVKNPDLKLKANSFARGEVILGHNVPLLVVPLESVVNFSGVTKVFVVADGVAHARQVDVGKIKDGRQEVLAGLKAGEVVVTTGQSRLYEGAKVAVKKADRAPDADATHPAGE